MGGANRVQGPDGTAIGDNNALAAALLVCVPLMNYLRLQSQHRIIRIGLAAAIVLTLFSVVGSYSRGALLGLLAVSVFLWVKSKHKMLAAVVIPVAVATVIFMPPEWMARMQTIDCNAPADTSVEGRYEIWHVAWEMAIKRPLTGSGFMGPVRWGRGERVRSGCDATCRSQHLVRGAGRARSGHVRRVAGYLHQCRYRLAAHHQDRVRRAGA